MKLTREDVIKKLENNDKDFEGLNLSELDLSGLDLSGLDLSYAILEDANLYNVNLEDANLEDANLSNAKLYKANLSNVNLENANLLYAYLCKANLSNSKLYNADLRNANLKDIKGKKIDTFHYNKHFAYYCDGILKIGCESKTPEEWLECYKELGKEHNYTELEIEMYLRFINMCKDLI